MRIGLRPVFLAAVETGDRSFRCVTVTSLVSAEVTEGGGGKVLLVLRTNSEFLAALRASRLFSVNLLTTSSLTDAQKHATPNRSDLTKGEDPSWDFGRGVPVHSVANRSLILELSTTIPSGANSLLVASVNRVLGGGPGDILYYGFGEYSSFGALAS